MTTRLALVTLASAVGLAACATPGQVRGVATQVAVLDREHARTDSARAADLMRVQQIQRQNMDSINMLVGRLNDAIQRFDRDNAAQFDNLTKQIYAVSNLAANTQSSVKRLSSQVDNAVSQPLPAPPPANPGDSSVRSPAEVVPGPDVLLEQAQSMVSSAAYGSARATLNRLITTYPTSPDVGEALYYIGYSFDIGVPPQVDSARVYYSRVAASYPATLHASTALFKLGELELKAGNVAAARKAWQAIVDRYKSADEFERAQSRLRENP